MTNEKNKLIGEIRRLEEVRLAIHRISKDSSNKNNLLQVMNLLSETLDLLRKEVLTYEDQ